MPKSLIVTCAHTPAMSLHLPVTPAEIAAAARERLGLKGADRVTF